MSQTKERIKFSSANFLFCVFFLLNRSLISDGMSQVLGISSTRRRLFLGVEDDTIILLLEPLHGVFLCETVLESNHATLASTLGNIITWEHENVDISDKVNDAKINVNE